jgi:hypothetical protein
LGLCSPAKGLILNKAKTQKTSKPGTTLQTS